MTMKDQDLQVILDAIHAAKTTADVQAVYDTWSTNYDQNLADMGYVAPLNAAKTFYPHHPNHDAKIMDAGCGTGLVGVALKVLGYTTIDGVDLSPEMLAIAQKTNAYQTLSALNFQDANDIPDNTYDAAICVGVLGPVVGGHLIDDLVRIVQPQGIVHFAIRAKWVESVSQPAIERLLAAGKIALVADVRAPYMHGQDAEGAFTTIRKL